MKKYKKSKLIKKFTTLTNVNKEGYHWYTMMILMKFLTNEKEKKLSKLLETGKIIDAVKTIGDWNVLLNIKAKNPKEFHSIANNIRTIFKEEIKDYDTLLAYKELKNENLLLE